MKKIALALFAITFASSLCFAQPAQAPATKPAPAPAVTKTLTGKVDSVTVGDATKKTISKIEVMDDKGQKLSLRVISTASITSKDGKKISLTDIKKDNKVVVEYTTNKKGTHRAQSIKLAG